jgi:hypothetical protein
MADSLASILAGAGGNPYAGGTNLAPLIGSMLMAQSMRQNSGGGIPQQPMVPGQPPGMMPVMPSTDGIGQMGGAAAPMGASQGALGGPNPMGNALLPFAKMLGLTGTGS